MCELCKRLRVRGMSPTRGTGSEVLALQEEERLRYEPDKKLRIRGMSPTRGTGSRVQASKEVES